ncbi:zinc finger BED-type containing 5 [Chelydra serpentina]|uniref:Zinc finger BED-type containing 5 n=1 Tax=Chelydra serpentina TaxID=8475 RepID=A0A8T1TJS1_CHESE|nr:zinc finger BED-type containing 5 [Chelydra serpentina]
MEGENMKALEASYSVVYLIAKSGAAEVIGETLVKPAAKVMVQVMIGNKASKTIDRVPLSNNTVHRRITDMAKNIKQQLLSRVQKSRYHALQADESTDGVNLANLLLFVRYELNNEVHDDILFCQPIPTHTTGEAIFKVIDDFYQKQLLGLESLCWNKHGWHQSHDWFEERSCCTYSSCCARSKIDSLLHSQ